MIIPPPPPLEKPLMYATLDLQIVGFCPITKGDIRYKMQLNTALTFPDPLFSLRGDKLVIKIPETDADADVKLTFRIRKYSKTKPRVDLGPDTDYIFAGLAFDNPGSVPLVEFPKMEIASYTEPSSAGEHEHVIARQLSVVTSGHYPVTHQSYEYSLLIQNKAGDIGIIDPSIEPEGGN